MKEKGSENRPKMLVIGLDGASFDLILPWIENGSLPNLRSLINEGSYGDLTTVIPPGTAPAWSSLYTGKNPGKHGIYEFLKRKAGTYDFIPINASIRDSKDIWEILSDFGRKAIVFNAPVTYPPRQLNGFLVSGFPTPGDLSQYTYPSSLKERLKEAVPGYRVSAPRLSVFRSWDRYLKDAHTSLKKKADASLYLLRKYDWDFFMVVFSETDNLQHTLWAYMDKDYPSVPSRDRERYSHSIHDLYQSIDGIIGHLLSEAPDDIYVVVVSDHGAWPLRRIFHTNHFLHELGLLRFKSSIKTRLKSMLQKIGLEPLNPHGGFKSLNLVRFALFGLGGLCAYRFQDIDWSATSAYSIGYGQIFINLKGRDPKGIVASGSNCEKVKKTIINGLKAIRDPASDEKVVESCYLREEIYSGPHVNEAPDIQFLTSKGFAAFPYGFIVNMTLTDTVHFSGTHSMKGMIIMKGPGVEKQKIENASILDVAPTILHIMDIPLPADMDGKVLTNAFSKSYLNSKIITLTQCTPSKPVQVKELSIEDQKQIEDRLRSLGYVG